MNNVEFAPALAKIAVAQICDSLGLQGFQQSALDALSDITCKYIQDIGKLSTFYANLAGRTESNVLDVIHALENLGLSHGFLGGSDLNHCLLESRVIKEIIRYIGDLEEVGFAYSVPRFPVIKQRESNPSFFYAGETPVVDNVPPWLPCFPHPETYTILNTVGVEQTETKQNKVDQDLGCNGFKAATVVELGHNNGKERANNPFLASPLDDREMKVSLVSLPARLVEEDVAQNHSLWAKHISSLWTFAPVVQEFKSCDLDTYDGSKEVGVERRPVVQLKFYRCKKSSATGNEHRKTENAESMSWFAMDDSRNDKKMIKEKIVEEPFENGKHAY